MYIVKSSDPLTRISPRASSAFLYRSIAYAFISAFPWSVFAKVNYIQFEGQDLAQSAWCSMPFHEEDLDTTPLYFTVASTFLYFVVPFTIVFVLYLR